MQEEKRNWDDGIELDLKELLWSVLRHWRSFLVAVLLVGLSMALYGSWREYSDLTNKSLVRKRQEAYETELENYVLTKERLEKRLKGLEEELQRQGFYESNAVMLLVDQYQVYTVKAAFYIDTNYEISPQLFFQNPDYTEVITKSYVAALERLDLDTVIATVQMPDLTARNPVDGSKKRLMNVSVDKAGSLMNVTICGDTQERAEKIYEAVKETIESQKELLNQAIGAHTLQTLYEISETDIDTEFGALQTSFEENLEDISKGIEDTNKSLQKLAKPVNQVPTMKSVVRQGVKYCVAGAAAALMCLSAFYAVSQILRDRLSSTEEIVRRYGLPVLGVVAEKADRWGRLDRGLASKLGVNVNRDADEALQYLAANVRFYLRGRKKLLLMGNCEDSRLRGLRDELAPLLKDVELCLGGNVNESAAAVDALGEACAVVCAEQWMETPHSRIRHELRTVEKSGNPNLGFIVVC